MPDGSMTVKPIKFIYNDGGRRAAGFKGTTGDCGVRAIAIATGKPYREVYDDINRLCKLEKPRKRYRRQSASRTGLHVPIVHQYLTELGFVWVPTMKIGSGCQVHLRENELPGGRLVTRLSKHYAAVVDWTLFDTYDSSRDGTRCVYGFWQAT